jgi:SAM-dependent methyltransferase
MNTPQWEKEINRAVRPYTAPVLFFYDAGVYSVWNPFIWRCPSFYLEEHYKRYVGGTHLEAGCGTGYLPHRCNPLENPSGERPMKQWELTLLDYSPGSLTWAGRRLKRFKPHSIRHNLFLPLPAVSHPFESICLNYVLHCLPGSFPEKEKVIAHLKGALAPEGVLFGSTILGRGVPLNYAARVVLTRYNALGSFHNNHDTEEGLKKALSKNFHHVRCTVIGAVALFAASDKNLKHGEQARSTLP